MVSIVGRPKSKTLSSCAAVQAIGQLRATASVAHNISQARLLIRKAHEAGAEALFLPEACDYITTGDSTQLCKSAEDSEFVLSLQSEARKLKLPINVGIHEPAAGGKVKNTLIWINEAGQITRRYQKLHLFDVNIKQGPQLQESKSVECGKEIPEPFNTPVGKLGLQICFDLRFPEPALALRARGAQIITYPSAFTTPTGKAGHWEILLRARAIETQSYIIAAAQVGIHDEEGRRRSYGHSMIVDPWGKILAKLGGDTGSGEAWEDEGSIAVADIDLGYINKIRAEVPLLRRTDVYPAIV